jgi:hypothetical protein
MESTTEGMSETDIAKLKESVKGIVHELEAEATRRIGLRQPLEERWIEDLEQYHGRYPTRTRKALVENQQSQVFLNMTRPKTDAMTARLSDLLFPTDDKNWSIGPTPVPELTAAADAAKEAVRQAAEAEQAQMMQAGQEGQQPAPEATQRLNAAKQAARDLDHILAEGKKRASLMAEEIDDQLKESLYHAAMRDIIEDGCKLGTGVCKGPVTGDKIRKGWKQRQRTDQTGQPMMGPDGNPMQEYALQMSAGETPAIRHVDIWGFFPDMDATSIRDGNGVYERHIMNKKQLRELARLPGYDKDALKRLLMDKPRESAPSYMASLRNLNEAAQNVSGDVYHVWEYSGPVEPETMRDLAMAMNDEATLRDIEIDPLEETHAVVWFCQGELLKFAIYPLDSYECMYSVFTLARDEASMFGYGIPAIMRDPQAILNGAARALMDNAGLAAGPQIVVNRSSVKPANGEWRIEPRKIWFTNQALPTGQTFFNTFDIPMQQEQLTGIIVLAKQMIDEMTAMPMIAQGEQGGATKTVQGMSLLMNSANVVFRRIVKNFDDDVTVPNIRRMYDWNMQFSTKEHIKGDFEVDARGSSVLLVREMQAQNLMFVAQQLGAHPVYGPMLKNRDVLRKLFQSMMIPTDEVILTDDEIDVVLAKAAAAEAEAAKAEQAAGAGDGSKETGIDAQVAIANMNNDTKLAVARLNHETQMMKMAEAMNLSIDKIEAMLEDKREERQSRERIVAVEAAMAQRTGQHAGGYV